jgi:hypothetical protein
MGIPNHQEEIRREDAAADEHRSFPVPQARLGRKPCAQPAGGFKEGFNRGLAALCAESPLAPANKFAG